MLRALGHVLGWLDGPLRLRWAALVPVVCVAAIIEAIGAVAVFGLFRLVVEPRATVPPPLSDWLPAWLPHADSPWRLTAFTGVVAAFYGVRAVVLVWAEWFKEATVARSAGHAAEQLLSRYLAADYRFHLDRRSTTLIQEVARSTDAAYQLFAASAVNIIGEIATLTGLVAILLLSAPWPALGAVALVVALVVMPLWATRRRWHRSGEEMSALERQQLHALQQSLGAVKELKVAGREAFFAARLRGIRTALVVVRQRRAWLATAQRMGVETALILAMLAGLLIITTGGVSGGATLSLLALFAYAGFRIVPAANRIMLNAGYMREAHAFVGGAIADFAALKQPLTRHPSRTEPMSFQTALTCEHVTFVYESGARPALSDVSLRVDRGQSLGIVGATGSGKSTLVDVLMGLLEPTAGRVLIDGQPLAGREPAWQRLMGYVPQTPYLLDDSLRRNIAFGVPDAAIDDGRLAQACTLARLDDLVASLPAGLNTNIGEDGGRLSGGQRQRVAIARALYADPAVLVFDEATSSLDPQTEREITDAIAALQGTRTVIVIAHRLSTVAGCDRLVFLHGGRVAAAGRYADVAAHPEFRAMAQVAAPTNPR